MKKLFNNYKSTIILLTSIFIGALIGFIFKEDASILSPLGDLFLNLLLIAVVPLIFVSISLSISKMNKPKRFGKIMASTIFVFVITTLITVTLSFIIVKFTNLINVNDSDSIRNAFDYTLVEEKIEINLLERTVNMISTNDFVNLFSTSNLLALIVIAILFGLSINMSKKKGTKVIELLDSLNTVIMNYIKLIMYYAPIGLLCYFASLIGTLGTTIAVGYLNTFIIYLIVCIIVFFVFYSAYAYIAAGKKGFIAFWKNILPASLTALGTCSSAASVPSNITCTKNIGVPEDIAETTISLGTSFHKDGSTIGSVFKIMFLVSLFGTSISTFSETLEIFIIAILATLLISAIPLGGGTISEMLIISMLGLPVAALPILTIIAAVIDAPATLLNVVGDSSSSMLISRLVEGKNWLK